MNCPATGGDNSNRSSVQPDGDSTIGPETVKKRIANTSIND